MSEAEEEGFISFVCPSCRCEIEATLDLIGERTECPACGIRLVDFKLEFGRTAAGEIVVADEISPDTCRLWDLESGRRLDRDRFRRDMGDIVAAYQEVYDRLCNHAKND